MKGDSPVFTKATDAIAWLHADEERSLIRLRVQYCRKCGKQFRARENGYCEVCRCTQCTKKTVYKTLQLCGTHYANLKYHTSEERKKKQKASTRAWYAQNRDYYRIRRQGNKERVRDNQKARERYRLRMQEPGMREFTREYNRQNYIKRNLVS